jgi:hypothetical protein
LKRVCNVNIVYGNLGSKNSQDYAPQQNYTFMNLASVKVVHLLRRSAEGVRPSQWNSSLNTGVERMKN